MNQPKGNEGWGRPNKVTRERECSFCHKTKPFEKFPRKKSGALNGSTCRACEPKRWPLKLKRKTHAQVRAAAVAEERKRLLEVLNKKIAAHKTIQATHTVYPKDWHEGNLNALSEIRALLTDKE